MVSDRNRTGLEQLRLRMVQQPREEHAMQRQRTRQHSSLYRNSGIQLGEHSATVNPRLDAYPRHSSSLFRSPVGTELVRIILPRAASRGTSKVEQATWYEATNAAKINE